jgi:uncharacterized membrane protein
MKRTIDRLDLLAFALQGAAAIGTAAVFDQLPDPMPTHFDPHGHPNGWMPRAIGAFLLPGIALGVWALVRFGATMLNKKAKARLEASPVSAVGLLLSGFFAILQGLLIQAALLPKPRLGESVWWSIGGLFVLLGLLMPRVRKNPWMGMRTPWTLASDENWARTHRFAGYTMILGGGACILASMVGAPLLGIVCILAGSLAPVLYSWRLAHDGV